MHVAIHWETGLKSFLFGDHGGLRSRFKQTNINKSTIQRIQREKRQSLWTPEKKKMIENSDCLKKTLRLFKVGMASWLLFCGRLHIASSSWSYHIFFVSIQYDRWTNCQAKIQQLGTNGPTVWSSNFWVPRAENSSCPAISNLGIFPTKSYKILMMRPLRKVSKCILNLFFGRCSWFALRICSLKW